MTWQSILARLCDAVEFCVLLRCESFNGLMRTQNVYSNRQAPSRDIGKSFGVLNYIRYICDGGVYDGDKRYLFMYHYVCGKTPYPLHNDRCGDDLKQLFDSAQVQHYVNGTTVKELRGDKVIYQPGTLRKVGSFEYSF